MKHVHYIDIVYKPKVLESIFAESINPGKKNSFIGCIYIHPLMELDLNMNFLHPLMKIN